MADEILKIDENDKPVVGFVTDDSNQFIRNARIDDTTKGLKVMIVGGVGGGTVTSITASSGILLTPNPIITTGTVGLAANIAPIATLGSALQSIRVNAGATALEYYTPSVSSGTVTSVSVTTANGVSGVVATATTTPAITLTLGAITPTSVNGASSTEVGYLVGVTSAIQTQLNTKGAGTVTAVSIATANGFSGSSSGGATPALTIVAGAITPTTVNGNTFTTGTYTLTGQAGKTLTFNGSITLTGTDAQTYTFPTTSATLARTDAANTFTGVQTMTSPSITTSIDTSSVSLTAFAGATTLLTIGGTGASASLFAPSTLDTSSSTTGAIRTSGGISAAKSANIGTTITVGTGYQIGGAAASNKILKGNGTNFVASTETYAAPGTSGNVMTSDGTNWTSAAPSGGTPKIISATIFETSGRFNTTVSGGTATFNNSGLVLDTTSTTTRYASVGQTFWGGTILWSGSPTFTAAILLDTKGTAMTSFFGIGLPAITGAGITFTENHIGFKLITVASTCSLYATQADGTTENVSAALTTVAAGDYLELIAVANGSTNVSYYWRQNSGALSSATVLTGNVPTSSGGSSVSLGWEISNQSTATQTIIRVFTSSYQR